MVNACQKIIDALQTKLDDNVDLSLFEPLASMALEIEAFLELETLVYRTVEDPTEGAQGGSPRVKKDGEFASQRLTDIIGEDPVAIPQDIDETGERQEVLTCRNENSVSHEETCSDKENHAEVPQQDDGMGESKFQELKISSLWNLRRALETKTMMSKVLICNGGEIPVQVPPQSEELGGSIHQELKNSSLGNSWRKLETNVLSQGLLASDGGENHVKVTRQNDEWGADEHQEPKNLSIGHFSSGRRTRSISSQGLTYKVGENHVQIIDGNGNGKENCNLMGPSPGGFGSMRKEKEWKRTLACKLYEERQSVDGTEGMDQLWEVYEVDSGKAKAKVKNKKEKMVKKEDVKHYEDEEDEDEEDEERDSQLCCLQALRFSTGKMNLGMGRLNSMRITKAFKGMGLFVRKDRKIS